MQHIAILTSGGDAPGMNAAVNAIVRDAERHGLRCSGFYHGFNGLLSNDYSAFSSRVTQSVAHMGGTLLKSGRCPTFAKIPSLQQAAATLNTNKVDCLIAIGGDGTLHGCEALSHQWHGQIIGVPATIDNDIDHTDASIGFHTAVNTVVNAVDNIRDTAEAFERLFLIEVMGNGAGHLALRAAVASNAEHAIVPEQFAGEAALYEALCQHVSAFARVRPHGSFICLLTEKLWPAGVAQLAKEIEKQTGIESRPLLLGHLQRGGKPVAEDRLLANKLGAGAVEIALAHGHRVMVGISANRLCAPPITECLATRKPLDADLLNIQQLLLEDYHP